MQPEMKCSGNIPTALATFLLFAACLFSAFGMKAQNLVFADPAVESRALLKGDLDGDGHISKAEADSLKSLNLT